MGYGNIEECVDDNDCSRMTRCVTMSLTGAFKLRSINIEK